jgi:hypothetical protein
VEGDGAPRAAPRREHPVVHDGEEHEGRERDEQPRRRERPRGEGEPAHPERRREDGEARPGDDPVPALVPRHLHAACGEAA